MMPNYTISFFLRAILAFSAFLFASSHKLSAQKAPEFQLIDSVLKSGRVRPFSGIVLIGNKEEVTYQFTAGRAGLDSGKTISQKSQFVIGSISKQITAVLVLRAVDEGHLSLSSPLRKYLPTLDFPWADTVTVHHLLNHTHGIQELSKRLAFTPGTQFAYSQFGYELLAQILENVNGVPYPDQVTALFRLCGMKHSLDPRHKKARNLVQGFVKNEQDSLVIETATLSSTYVPAGLLISTAEDLLKWNSCLHGGKLLLPATYLSMINPSAQRDHVLWGLVGYGYGVQMKQEAGLMEIGHTGYVPGYISMNFYYPETGTTLLVLENIDWAAEDTRLTFCYEIAVRSLLLK